MKNNTKNSIRTIRSMSTQRNNPSWKRCTFYLLITCLLALAAAPATAATYYLDAVNGSNGNNGTSQETAWEHISYAWSKVGPGDIVKLGSGTYNDPGRYGHVINYARPGVDSWENKVVFTNQEGKDPVIEDHIYLKNARLYVEFRNLKFRPLAQKNGVYINSAKNIRIINCDIQGPWNTNYYPEHTDPSTGCNLLGGNGMYIVGGTLETPMDDITIQGCSVSQFCTGIKVGCYIGDTNGDWVIKDNEIHTTAQSQLTIGASGSTTNGHILIENNHIHDNYQFQYGNEAWEITHASGIAIRADNMTIKGNIIHATGSTGGITFYTGSGGAGGFKDMVVENNLLYDIRSQYAARIYDIHDTGSVIFRNNTIIGHETGNTVPALRYGQAVTFRPINWATGGEKSVSCSGLKVYNNIVVGMMSFEDAQTSGDGGMESYTEDYNYCYSMSDPDGNYNNTGANTTLALTARYGSPSEVFASGYFVGANYTTSMHRLNLNDVYRLVEGSSAIGRSAASYSVATDILGNPRDANPDAGCFEYISESENIPEPHPQNPPESHPQNPPVDGEGSDGSDGNDGSESEEDEQFE